MSYLTSGPSLTVGNRVFTDLTNLITLVGYTSTANTYCTMRKPNSASGYQVTSGKILKISAIVVIANTTNFVSATAGYGDNDVGMSSASQPTNAFWIGGDGNMAIATSAAAANGTYVNSIQASVDFNVPALKFVAGQAVNGKIIMYGYES